MTALKAIEQIQRVQNVQAKRYPLNETCSNPNCDKPVESGHHIFGRNNPVPDSWFSTLPVDDVRMARKPIPAVTGVCGDGTTGCHGDLEGHRTWIKYEDGVFVWYDRSKEDPIPGIEGEVWHRVGPLDPQPGYTETKKKVKRKRGEERKKRETISIKIPKDAQEDGGQVWDDLLGDGKDDKPYGRVRERLNLLMPPETPQDRPAGDRDYYYVIVDALEDWLNG